MPHDGFMANSHGAAPRLLLSTGSLFHLPPAHVAGLAARAGFDGLELIVNSPKMAPGEAMEAVHEACPILSLHAPFRDWSKWGGHLDSWKATTALANFLPSANHITLHPPQSGLGGLISTRWFKRAYDLPVLLDAKGRVEYSLENMPWVETPFGRDPLDKLMDQCRDKNVGLTLDVCHLGVSGRDILSALDRVPMELLYHVHFSDSRGHREHMAPGEGELPLYGFLQRLAERGYSRIITLELEPAAFPDDDEGTLEILTDMQEFMAAALEI